MDFYLNDLTDDARERLFSYKTVEEDKPIASLIDFSMNENCPQVAGEFKYIQQLILILKEMGYIDFNLYYEDCNIWILKWHNPEFDGARWMLVE